MGRDIIWSRVVTVTATEAIAKACAFNGHHGNILEIEDNHLTGKVIPPILDKNAKLAFLNQYTAKCGISKEETLSVGDGVMIFRCYWGQV